ncbi:hypothetical protein [Uliginosibacterium sp. H1]|uniref:hypothetical protein n=1 Tax=Uliginosibacterium sp. H1 TaxID=3114757 RepID=UPI002E17E5B7|nr:hypothetical protein [Uliginosibacterium sp. H1]
MSIEEIDRRIDEGQLTPLARAVAEEEIRHRTEDPVGYATSGLPRSALGQTLLVCSLGGATVAVLLYLGHPVAALAVAGLAVTALGALFPLMGRFLGIGLMLVPVGVLLWLAMRGGLDRPRHDWGSLELLINYGALFLLSMLALGLGGFLLKGAQTAERTGRRGLAAMVADETGSDTSPDAGN